MLTDAHSHSLWHYLGTFVLYTLLAIAFIYGTFIALKKNPAWLNLLTGRRVSRPDAPLSIETSLPLEARKTLHIVRCGEERFLIATGAESTQFLSKLNDPAMAGCSE